jgi:hypothetical protein
MIAKSNYENYKCTSCTYTTYIAEGLLMHKPPICPICNSILEPIGPLVKK